MRPDAQTAVALAIVFCLGTLGVFLVALAYFEPSVAAMAWGSFGAIIGALATSLNAPTGILAALNHGDEPKDNPPA